MINRSVLAVLIVNFMGMFSYSIALPLFPYYAATFHASPFQIGLIFSSYSLFQFFAAPMMGRLSDAQGRKKWLLLSLMGTAVSFICMALAGSMFWLFVARMIDGISGGNLTITQAIIGDHTTSKNRTQMYSYLVTSQGCGIILGPLVASYLSSHFGYAPAMWIAALIASVATLLIFVLLPHSAPQTSDQPTSRVWESLQNSWQQLNPRQVQITPQLRSFYVLAAVTGAIFAGFFFTLGQYMQLRLHFSPAQAGWASTVFGVVILGYQFLFAKPISQRFHDTQLLSVGVGLLLIVSVLMSVAWNMTTILVCVLFYGFAVNLVRATLSSLVTQEAGPNQKGVALGFLQSINSLCQVIIPITNGWLLTHVSYAAPGVLGGGVILLFLVWRKVSTSEPLLAYPVAAASLDG